jgi:hypothetical protein
VICPTCSEPDDFCYCPTEDEAAEIRALAIPTFDVTRVHVTNDEFAQCATKLMRLANKVGWPAAITEELEHPSCDHPMWFDLIEALHEDKPIPKPTTPDPDRMSWCVLCGGGGVVVLERKRKMKHSNLEYETVRPCTACPKGAMMMGWMSKGTSGVTISNRQADENQAEPKGFKQVGPGSDLLGPLSV